MSYNNTLYSCVMGITNVFECFIHDRAVFVHCIKAVANHSIKHEKAFIGLQASIFSK